MTFALKITALHLFGMKEEAKDASTEIESIKVYGILACIFLTY